MMIIGIYVEVLVALVFECCVVSCSGFIFEIERCD